jgi:hypothetical protein
MFGGGGTFGSNPNNNPSMFGNTNNSSLGGNMFNANTSNNQQGSFLNNFGQSNLMAPPPGAVNSNLMQMRK